MERAFHSTSHLGRMNVDGLIPYTPVSLRRHLEIYRNGAANKMKMAVQSNNGDMWARAWRTYREYSEQIAVLDAATGRTQ